MQEYRFSGVNVAGEPVRGVIFAGGRRAAQRRVDRLSQEHLFEPDGLERRRLYQYKVRRPNGEIFRGRQKAYAAEEVERALAGMDLEVLSVQRIWVEVALRPSTSDLVTFVRLSANMLRRGVAFHDVLNLLISDVTSESLRQVMRDLHSDLQSGMSAQQAFMKHQDALGPFMAYMLGLAASSNRMADIYEATARYLQRKDAFKKGVRSALLMPAVTFLATLAVFVWYVWFIIPETVSLFGEMNVNMPFFTGLAMDFAGWMDAHYMAVGVVSTLALVGAIGFGRTERGRFVLHKNMLRLPLLGGLLHRLNLEVFCRVFGVLHASHGNNREVMERAAEATGNAYLAHRVRTVTLPMMMAQGADLLEAMKAGGVFTPMLLAHFRQGISTGTLYQSVQELADFFEKETTMRLENTVEAIKTAVALLIGLLVTFLTIVSAETALITPTP